MDVVHLNQKQLAARWNISEVNRSRFPGHGFEGKSRRLDHRQRCGAKVTTHLCG